ncbi:MAG TPA: hypothetical protein VGP24_15240 [Glaciihabitans sp.]|nr:hypothetical protein [Glaciihabitans sp.]
MAREHESSAEYEPNLEDERVVDLTDDDDFPAPPPTIDPDERLEDIDEEPAPLDDDRTDVI